jgi:chromosome segregation ATPase
MIAEVEAALDLKRQKVEELLSEAEAAKKEVAQQQKKLIEDSRSLLEREETLSQLEDRMRSGDSRPAQTPGDSAKRGIAG